MSQATHGQPLDTRVPRASKQVNGGGAKQQCGCPCIRWILEWHISGTFPPNSQQYKAPKEPKNSVSHTCCQYWTGQITLHKKQTAAALQHDLHQDLLRPAPLTREGWLSPVIEAPLVVDLLLGGGEHQDGSIHRPLLTLNPPAHRVRRLDLSPAQRACMNGTGRPQGGQLSCWASAGCMLAWPTVSIHSRTAAQVRKLR